jgi:murein DD-endopeptidase MepM/ murein hydrolase activator NlpD
MQENKLKKFFYKIINERFRITFFHDDFKPVFSLRFTIFTFFLWIVGFATIIIFITTFIIAKTSLKEYIPGYGKFADRKIIIDLNKKMDSLQNVMITREIYIQAILKAIEGEKDSIQKPLKKNTIVPSNEKLKPGDKELEVRKELEKELSKNVFVRNSLNNDNNLYEQFLPPAQGILIHSYNPKENHFGIDIAGKNETPVRSIYKGIIVYSGYSTNDGNFLIILHPNGFTSIYKHLSNILKNTGSYVNSNDIIGTMGNTGSESNGTHLHFELWYKQNPQNPVEFISF